MFEQEKKIYVYASWIQEKNILIGILYVSRLKGKEEFSFEYDANWLSTQHDMNLDPNLSFYQGRQYAPNGKNNFGIFVDSCPDRFGRTLMKRREIILAKKEQRKPNELLESDYLLGVNDVARMGGLRFSLDEGKTFLSNEKDLSTPPMTALRTLENASIALETAENEEVKKWLKIILAPGSSLGGARPKANVISPEGDLWIAKFPSKNDEWNTGAWEMVVHDLAKMCAINVPDAKLENFSKYGSTFLVKRFDRNKNQRIHFSSAMTLLNHIDGEDASYLELVSFIRAYGASPKEDLLELFKRVTFSISVSNTDDHLRNHGFLLMKNGWKLSPMYDVNPNIYGQHLSLRIDEYDNTLDYDVLLSTSSHYGLSQAQAKCIINEIKNIISANWRDLAIKYGISRKSIEDMAPAFFYSSN